MLNSRRVKFSLVFASIIGMFAMTSVAFAQTKIKIKMSPEQLAQNKCSRCHSYALLQAKAGSSAKEWLVLIDKMKNAGLVITSEEQGTIANYLANTK